MRRRRLGETSAERAVESEIRHHIEELADRLVAGGRSRADALAEAQRRFGDIERIRGEMKRSTRVRERRLRISEFVFSVVADVHYGFRGLGRNLTFAVTVLATIALGIGAAATVFTVADSLLLRPLPYREPDRLVTLNLPREDGGSLPFLMADQIERWAELAEPLEGLALYEHEGVVRTDGGEPEMLQALHATANLDETIGLRAHVGRTFSDEDGVPGSARVMLGYAYWQRLGAGASALGSTVVLEGRTYEVVGVLPRDFKFPVAGRPADVWIVLGSDLKVNGNPLPRASVVARIAGAHSIGTAQARLDEIANVLQRESPHRMGWKLELEPVGRWRGNRDLVNGVRMLAGAVLLMLLLALANGVNLLLFRATDRARELSIRLALGGARRRLIRQLLTEGLLLGIAGGTLAVILALVLVAGLNRILPSEFSFSSVYSFRIESRVLTFAFLISVASGTVLGLIPGFQAIRRLNVRFDRLNTRGTTRSSRRLNYALATTGTALAMALLALAGLLTNSLLRLTRNDPGFDAERVALLAFQLPETRYPDNTSRVAFFERLEPLLEALPEVEAASIADGVPTYMGLSFANTIQAEGQEPIVSEQYYLLPTVRVTPDFVPTIGARILAGRNLEHTDAGTRNALIDERLARALWGQIVTGRQFRTADDEDWHTAVGVFQHMTMYGLDDRATPYSLILPRNPRSAAGYIALRTTGDPKAALLPVRRAVQSLDGQLAISKLEPARAALADTIEKPRFLASIMIALSITAMTLAAIGLYGVLAYAAAQRRREMGIRLALGAAPHNVRALFLRQGALVAVIGIGAGVTTGAVLGRLARSLFFGVEPGDPLTLAAVAAIMLSVALVASLAPTLRAARVPPSEVLHSD